MSVATTFSLGDISTDRIKRIVVTRRGPKQRVMDDLQSIAYFQHVHKDAEVKWNKGFEVWESTKPSDAYVSFTAKLKD